MSDERDLRLSRQISLPAIGRDGQARLAEKSLLIVGLGGLGAPAALYLANAGIGKLSLNDFDRVDPSNLPRQILFDTASVGEYKTTATAAQLAARCPDVELVELNERLSESRLREEIETHDAVLDCTDNFAARFMINDAAVATRTPVVTGAAIRFEGQLAVLRHDRHRGPCYRCLYAEQDDNLENCAGQGILGSVAGTVGCLMATETVKLLLDLPSDLESTLWVYDGASGKSRTLKITRRPDCPTCG